ncbi:DEAD/DEAH box helicase, putative [Eimeria tenella]|uniref:DNA 3'-5' helicase n=1 Tax=Eimeria tenella TaxID=5802 RepID=U6L2S9_EIMTE|nr:DEAD/DEAH box helicase, putative [Eimeria tenella]CDJ42080.1 DEAD/DEAH box helicase, putative [Eimeria tenella]|eukprot:XP_013232830.1 DEAD/DEAH box helicase, putative [Eimeria tenella]
MVRQHRPTRAPNPPAAEPAAATAGAAAAGPCSVVSSSGNRADVSGSPAFRLQRLLLPHQQQLISTAASGKAPLNPQRNQNAAAATACAAAASADKPLYCSSSSDDEIEECTQRQRRSSGCCSAAAAGGTAAAAAAAAVATATAATPSTAATPRELSPQQQQQQQQQKRSPDCVDAPKGGADNKRIRLAAAAAACSSSTDSSQEACSSNTLPCNDLQGSSRCSNSTSQACCSSSSNNEDAGALQTAAAAAVNQLSRLLLLLLQGSRNKVRRNDQANSASAAAVSAAAAAAAAAARADPSVGEALKAALGSVKDLLPLLRPPPAPDTALFLELQHEEKRLQKREQDKQQQEQQQVHQQQKTEHLFSEEETTNTSAKLGDESHWIISSPSDQTDEETAAAAAAAGAGRAAAAMRDAAADGVTSEDSAADGAAAADITDDDDADEDSTLIGESWPSSAAAAAAAAANDKLCSSSSSGPPSSRLWRRRRSSSSSYCEALFSSDDESVASNGQQRQQQRQQWPRQRQQKQQQKQQSSQMSSASSVSQHSSMSSISSSSSSSVLGGARSLSSSSSSSSSQLGISSDCNTASGAAYCAFVSWWSAGGAAAFPAASLKALQQQHQMSLSSFFSTDTPLARQALQLNRQIFKHDSLRGLQLPAISAVCSGKDTFVVMPTGGGKSLCYQLAALLLGGVCVVVSPLLALMEDQQRHMQQKGLFVERLDASLSKPEVRRVYADLRSKSPKTQVLLITAERLSRSKRLAEAMAALHSRRLLRLFVVDEAHLVSQWGEDFREEYLSVSFLKTKYRGVPIMALTASASPELERRVLSLLRISVCCSFRMSCDRPNLFLEVHRKTKETVAFIAAAVSSPPLAGCCGIIYCLSTKDCEALAAKLSQRGVRAVPYHAKMTHSKRAKVSAQWGTGAALVVCCTVAFGLGVDRADVRFVFHHSMPPSIERYYQEIGRAGRDGQPARCILFYLPHDATRLNKLHAEGGAPSRGPRRGRGRNRGPPAVAAAQQLAAPFVLGPSKEALKAKGLEEMQRYCEEDTECRRAFLLRALGETQPAAAAAAAICNAQCDNCWRRQNSRIEEVDAAEAARVLLLLLHAHDAAAAGDGHKPKPLTRRLLRLASRSASAKAVLDRGATDMSCYGALRGLSSDQVDVIICEMLRRSLLKEEFVKGRRKYSGTSVLLPGPAAHDFLCESRPFVLRVCVPKGAPKPLPAAKAAPSAAAETASEATATPSIGPSAPAPAGGTKSKAGNGERAPTRAAAPAAAAAAVTTSSTAAPGRPAPKWQQKPHYFPPQPVAAPLQFFSETATTNFVQQQQQQQVHPAAAAADSCREAAGRVQASSAAHQGGGGLSARTSERDRGRRRSARSDAAAAGLLRDAAEITAAAAAAAARGVSLAGRDCAALQQRSGPPIAPVRPSVFYGFESDDEGTWKAPTYFSAATPSTTPAAAAAATAVTEAGGATATARATGAAAAAAAAPAAAAAAAAAPAAAAAATAAPAATAVAAAAPAAIAAAPRSSAASTAAAPGAAAASDLSSSISKPIALSGLGSIPSSATISGSPGAPEAPLDPEARRRRLAALRRNGVCGVLPSMWLS